MAAHTQTEPSETETKLPVKSVVAAPSPLQFAGGLTTPPQSRHASCITLNPKSSRPTTHAKESVQKFAFEIDHDKLMEGVAEVLFYFFPHWAPEHVEYDICTAGITNKLVKCQNTAVNDTVLVRCYGKGSNSIIDRRQELENLMVLSSLGLSPSLYGQFENGLVYGYVEGVPFSVSDMQHPRKSQLVAQQLARWHHVELPGESRRPMLFPTIQKWLKSVPVNYSDPVKRATFASALSLADIQAEFTFLQQFLEQINAPVAFCHNDLLSGNIVYDEKQDEVAFIDYEYGSYSYRAFDIANHFCEHAGFDCDWSLLPSTNFKTQWLHTYLTHFNREESIDASVVEQLHDEVERFSLASHFYWAIWALVQVEISDIDFDYINYALKRLAEYFRKKDELLRGADQSRHISHHWNGQ
ncbi:choline/ethanolamine kinase [Phlyctochytrium arcticum]|nr:choline/ethanolamine kinase [Phlyctochytrium arcticum]